VILFLIFTVYNKIKSKYQRPMVIDFGSEMSQIFSLFSPPNLNFLNMVFSLINYYQNNADQFP
jgi:hypothetical protein